MLRTEFSPLNFANLSLWLDGSDRSSMFDATTGGSVVAADAAVGRWEDRSGNGRHATQGTFNNRPLLKTGILNGLSGLQFDNTNDSLSTATFTHTVDFTLFVVHRFTSATQGSFARIVEHGANNGLTIANDGPNNIYGVQYASTTISSVGVNYNTSARILEYQVNNSATRTLGFRVNGGTEFTTTRTGTPTTPTAFFINRFGGSEGFYSAQQVHEIVYYGRQLSAAERTAVRTYLNSKWQVF